VSCALSNSCTSPFWTVFLFDLTTPSSLRLLLNVCACTARAPHEDHQFIFPSAMLSNCFSCHFFQAFEEDGMLSLFSRFPAFSALLPLI
jgi:hypothetical protein